MKINSMQAMQQVVGTSKLKKAYGNQTASKGKDTLALSDFAKELSVAKGAVDKTPDVRQAKVDEIKSQMEAGTYNVTAAQIADKLIGEL